MGTALWKIGDYAKRKNAPYANRKGSAAAVYFDHAKQRIIKNFKKRHSMQRHSCTFSGILLPCDTTQSHYICEMQTDAPLLGGCLRQSRHRQPRKHTRQRRTTKGCGGPISHQAISSKKQENLVGCPSNFFGPRRTPPRPPLGPPRGPVKTPSGTVSGNPHPADPAEFLVKYP